MNIGDSVKIVATPYVHDSLQPGKIGRIVEVMSGNTFNVVMADEHQDGEGDLSWPFYKDEIEVIDAV